MFIFLSKFLPLFAYPLGLASMLLGFSLIFRSKPRLSRNLITTALIILWVSSTTGFSTMLARSLEWRYKPPDEVPTAEAIVLLGGGTEPSAPPRPTVEVNSAGDRVLYAARLYQKGRAPLILLSGGEISWLNEGSSTPSEDMAEILRFIGIPGDALILENESKNTYENAVFSYELLSERDISRILLVTSAIHMPRAAAVFEKQGFEVIPMPVDYSVTEAQPAEDGPNGWITKILDIIPTSSSLSLTTNALKEYLGMLVYTIRGWM